MKNIAVLVLAVLGFAAAPATTHARSYYEPVAQHCARRLVCTKEVCRHTQCRWATDHCGRSFSYHVTTVTYVNLYSDGSRETFTRTHRA